jgi:hypothetical protein
LGWAESGKKIARFFIIWVFLGYLGIGAACLIFWALGFSGSSSGFFGFELRVRVLTSVNLHREDVFWSDELYTPVKSM